MALIHFCQKAAIAYSGCQRLFIRGSQCRSSLQKWPARKACGPERHPFESAEPITTLFTPNHPESGIYARFATTYLHPGVNWYANVAIITFFHKFSNNQISCKSIFFVQWTFFKQINWPRDETCGCREIKFHIFWVLQILLHSDSFWNWASVGSVSFATYLRSCRHTQVLNSLHRELRKSSVSPIMFS